MTQRPTVAEFAGAARPHVALEVSDLERSIAFYRILLGVEPSKLRPGYAKFEPAEPALNLTLNLSPNADRARRPGSCAHFGVEVRSSDAVEAAAARFEAAGLPLTVEKGTECCYAVQDKVWVSDPDGNPWEVFVVTAADAPRRAPADAPTVAACCATPQQPAESCCGGG